MANYLSRSSKKRERQERLERELRKAIATGVRDEKLFVFAEELRAARIRSVKAVRQHCWLIGSTDRHDRLIAELEATPLKAILSELGWTEPCRENLPP